MRLALVALVLTACSDHNFITDTDTDVDTDTDTAPDTDTDTDTDTGPVSDKDGDGYTVEEGDCNDDDPFVSPGWDEKIGNGVDDDCDGRIDEEWAGLIVFDYAQDTNTGERSGPRLLEIDDFGKLQVTTNLKSAFFPDDVAVDLDNKGWVAWNRGDRTLARIDRDGTVTPIGGLPTEWEDPNDEPLIFWGLTAHPDGYYLVSGLDRIFRIDLDGSWSVALDLACAYVDETHENCVRSLAADPETGEVLLLGYLGSIGTWKPGEAYTPVVTADPMAPTHSFMDARTHKGGFYAMGQDLESGKIKMWRYNRTESRLVEKGTWPNSEFGPIAMALHDDTGDFYVSAKGGWANSVWKMFASDGYTAQLFTTTATTDQQYRHYTGVAILWNEAQ